MLPENLQSALGTELAVKQPVEHAGAIHLGRELVVDRDWVGVSVGDGAGTEGERPPLILQPGDLAAVGPLNSRDLKQPVYARPRENWSRG